MANMETSPAGLRDQLTGALIGIARAVDGNEHLISASTDKIIREGLAAAHFDSYADDKSLRTLIQCAETEKRKLIPLCYECAAPCGKNNNYDMRRLWTASEDAASLKMLLLCGIRSLAADTCRAALLGRIDQEVSRFFYRALFAIGEKSFGVPELLPVAADFGKMNLRCMALLDEADDKGV